MPSFHAREVLCDQSAAREDGDLTVLIEGSEKSVSDSLGPCAVSGRRACGSCNSLEFEVPATEGTCKRGSSTLSSSCNSQSLQFALSNTSQKLRQHTLGLALHWPDSPEVTLKIMVVAMHALGLSSLRSVDRPVGRSRKPETARGRRAIVVVRAASKPGSATLDRAKLVAMRALGGTAALVASLVGLLACYVDRFTQV